jgi:hypothetical protein
MIKEDSMPLERKTVFLLFVSCCVLVIGAINCYGQSYSGLWGKNAETWSKNKIPDFTWAGYRQGAKQIPNYQSVINVMSFGAAGDGKTDNTIAFRKAIQQCRKEQALFIPAGNYLLSDTLVICKSKVCIRGEGPGKTNLFFSKGIEELYPDYNVHFPHQTKWAWSGAMILFTGNNEDCGIENLSVAFPDSSWAGHNFHERGYNGIGFSDKVHDGWIRNVRITGADVGIWIGQTAHHITAQDWVLDFGPKRGAAKLNGHHGVNVYGGYNLLERFELRGKFQHDLSVESDSSRYNVFHKGKGADLCIDHHNHAQSHNLFTDIDAGKGSRLWFSGGNDTPRGICFEETFWNIMAQNFMPYPNQYDRDKHTSNTICVGLKTQQPSQLNDPYGNWFETIDPLLLYPADLYEAQLQLKKKARKRTL